MESTGFSSQYSTAHSAAVSITPSAPTQVTDRLASPISFRSPMDPSLDPAALLPSQGFEIVGLYKEEDEFAVMKLLNEKAATYAELNINSDLKRLSVLQAMEALGSLSKAKIMTRQFKWGKSSPSIVIEHMPKIIVPSGFHAIETFDFNVPNEEEFLLVTKNNNIINIFQLSMSSTVGRKMTDLLYNQLHDHLITEAMGAEGICKFLKEMENCFVADNQLRLCTGFSLMLESTVVETTTIVVERRKIDEQGSNKIVQTVQGTNTKSMSDAAHEVDVTIQGKLKEIVLPATTILQQERVRTESECFDDIKLMVAKEWVVMEEE